MKQIGKIVYVDKALEPERVEYVEQLATELANRLEVPVLEYDETILITPDTLLLSHNLRHGYAGHLSDSKIPLILIDDHSDLYGTSDSCVAWVFRELLKGRKVHFLSFRDGVDDSVFVPSRYASNFHAYAYDNYFKIEVRVLDDAFCVGEKRCVPRPFESLKTQCEDMRWKQISLDTDAYQNRNRNMNEIPQLLRELKLDDHTYFDYWIHEESPQHLEVLSEILENGNPKTTA